MTGPVTKGEIDSNFFPTKEKILIFCVCPAITKKMNSTVSSSDDDSIGDHQANSVAATENLSLSSASSSTATATLSSVIQILSKLLNLKMVSTSLKRVSESPSLVCSISLAFDPVKSPDQYQVICIWNDVEKGWLLVSGDDEFLRNFYIEIYSSKTNSWREVISSFVSPLYALPSSFPRSGVYWNGCLHWIATEQNAMRESSLECGGHLYIIEVLASCYTNYNISKMETDYSGWKLMYKLDIERFINAYPGFYSHASDDKTLVLSRMVLLLVEYEEESFSKLVVLVDGSYLTSLTI
ncbi:hypothetical protein C5167_048783 [Papaver somniferum]|uniref:Uncharacterized protein n=1 Tax=Papaver somniferum TaxID=3469 RepID=A0A4Y7KIY2_PAPSO|nr:hypothetical protein C5167_048783 [Papaver somniferum]